MANMSYCRFQNTRSDLLDCFNALEDDDKALSKEEARACKWMFDDIIQFLYQNGIIDEEYDDIKEKLDEYIEEIKRRSE